MSEESKSGWHVLQVDAENMDTGEVYEIFNVLPNYGPEHHPTPGCWCHPEFDVNNVLRHNVHH